MNSGRVASRLTVATTRTDEATPDAVRGLRTFMGLHGRSDVLRPMAVLLLSLIAAGCGTLRIGAFSDPLSATEHLNLGVAYQRQGHLEPAKRQYRRALEKDHPRARLYLGNACMAAGDWRAAEQWYLEQIERVPDIPEGYNNLAWLYYRDGRHLERAEELAEKAVSLDESGHAAFQSTLRTIRAARAAREGQGEDSDSQTTDTLNDVPAAAESDAR